MADKELAKHNTRVETVSTIAEGKFRSRLCVPTARIDTKKRGSALKLFASFCPMCGEEIPR